MDTAFRIVVLTSLLSYVMSASPVDPHATRETQNLYNVLRTIARDPNKVLVGKQNPTMFGAYGGHSPYWTYLRDGSKQAWLFNPGQVHSNYTDELCDPCALTHDFPAVAGFDFGNPPTDMDEVPIYLLHRAHERGAIITMSWHANNIITGHGTHISGDNGDVLHSIKRLLPGGDHHHQFLSELDKIAVYAKARRDSHGKLIPIIFRPWHEMDGGWFWWGQHNDAHNTADDFKTLYQETVQYLRDTKGVHNFLYAFSPDCGGQGDDATLYPDDAFVDVIGVDCYKTLSRTDQFFAGAVENTVQFAESHDKIAALTEFGPSPAHLENHFLTQHIMRPLQSSSSATRIAYMLTWQNQCKGNTGQCSIYDAYPGHPEAQDYMTFYHDSHTMFLSHLKSSHPELYP